MRKCPKVIVIEDDAYIREAIQDALQEEGFEAVGFANGQEAIDGLIKCEDPCLILLDLMMPVMDGWQFLKRRQTMGDTVISIPVVVISAVPDPSQVEAAGARGWMRKPLDIDILLELVRKHCDPSRQAA